MRTTNPRWMCALLVAALAGCTPEPRLDEQAILTLVAGIDRAVVEMDAPRVGNFLGDNVVITMKGAQDQTMNKATYLDSLRRTWQTVTDYRYNRTDTKVALSGPRKAVVTSTIIEHASIRDQTLQFRPITSTSSETMVIELVGNRPVITEVTAEVEVEAN